MPPESEKENPTRGMKLEDASEETNTSGKSWFFGIGINTYKHFPPLNNAVGDVETILKVLQEKYHVDEAVTLFNQNATCRNIFEQLKRLEKELAEDDKLLILFSGHGFLGTGGGHWVPHEAELGYDFEYLSNFYLKVYLKNIKARHILVISDSCFSGSLFTEGTTRKIKGPEERLEHLKSRYGFCSGRHNEEVWDGPKGGHSPFAGSIIEILNENQQSLFRASVFAEKVLDRTTAQYRQLPRHGPLFEVGDNGGQYIFRLKNDEQAAFETAQKEDSISAYSSFIRKYSKGTYADMALNRIVELEEDQAWQEAKDLDRISGYFHYKKRYPEGRYISEAERAIERLEKDSVENLKTNNPPKPSIYNKQSHPEKPTILQNEKINSNIFTDPRDGQTYKTVELNGLTWIAENFNYDIGEGSSYINNDPMTSRKYGRLYSWEAAKKACPKGWRLPTDKDFKSLAVAFGGYYDKPSKKEIGDPHICFNALRTAFLVNHFAGYRRLNGTFDNYTKIASFWVATEAKSNEYYNYDFDVNSGAITRTHSPRNLGISCRYVQVNESDRKKNLENTSLGYNKKRNNLLVDPRDGQSYKTVEIIGFRWMAQNLNFDVGEGCWFYNNDPKNGEKYGRLYSWEAAEKACPPDWRLPTDQEWKELALAFGGFYDLENSKNFGDPHKAYNGLSEGGISGFSALLGGYRLHNGKFVNLGSNGDYWNATESDFENALSYYFNRGSSKLRRRRGNKAWGFSCRCVQKLPI